MAEHILPGSTLGVLGGGQLGRMFCVAARTMGYHLVVLDPDQHSPAGRIADQHIHADYSDQAALDALAAHCDAITTEFENVPAASLDYLAARKPVYPSASALRVAQNRHLEKQFAREAGLKPAPWVHIQKETDLAAAIEAIGAPAILKSASLGYDGKGQMVIDNPAQLYAAYQSVGRVECVLEQKIDLALEVSTIIARNDHGAAVFPLAENEHRNGILHTSTVPARVDSRIAEKAREQTLALAEALDYHGVLAVEFFVSKEGALLFNEMAPRTHNSGHYTRDACVTSQFEQQVRMMCGLKPGDTRLLSPVVMVNLLGDLWPPDWSKVLDHEQIKLHLYGKKEARPGRKMGHYNVLAEDVETAYKIATEVFAQLSG